MHLRQIIGSLAVGLGCGYLALKSGYTNIGIGAAIILAYLITSWTLASYHRTHYWLSRGSKGVFTKRCPNCDRSRHRMPGDWILNCLQCGWKPGLPVLRWFVKSLPAIQFRRSVSLSEAFLAGVALTILVYSRPESVGALDFRSPSLTPTVPNIPSFNQILAIGTALLILFAIILWAKRPQRYFCKNCGQDLGRGDPPETCPKCESNRFTTEDPGVGMKVRME
jgi:hypothetical protein